jgi:hypothetical protein
MTNLYHPFPLKCSEELKQYTLSYMSQFDVDNVYVKKIPMPSELRDIFNYEMSEYGLSGAWNFLCFKRKVDSRMHIDFGINERVHSGINIPLEGCADTHMYWMSGNYELVKQNISGITDYFSLDWHDTPQVMDRVEINDVPMLTVVDVPHWVTARTDGTYRTLLSIRLLGNPTFDEIIKTRFDNKSQT